MSPACPALNLLVAAEFIPGAPGGDWFHIKQLLRGFNWNHLSWWSMFNEPKDTTNLGARLDSARLMGRMVPQRRFLIPKRFVMRSILAPRAARHLRQFIERQKPDLLWIMAHDWTIPVFHRLLPGLGIPWHISVYDMPDIRAKVRMLGAPLAQEHLRMVEELYTQAASRCVIGEPMAVEMERRTGVKADLIERCAVEPEALQVLRARPPNPAPSTVLRIGYAGTIIAEDAFALFVAALQKIRTELPMPVEIHLFGSERYAERSWFDPTLFVPHGFVSEADLDRLYGQCHWGVAMMQMDDDDARYNRFSFPCKFTMSLAFGLPLICLGHPESGLMVLARKYRLGIMITDTQVDQVAETLKTQLFQAERLGEYRAEIARCAETDFDAERNRERLYALFQKDLK